jgi:hypothetical protein
MAINVTARDAMIAALSAAGLDAEADAVIAYLESLRDKNQHNSEVLAELSFVIDNIDPTEAVP